MQNRLNRVSGGKTGRKCDLQVEAAREGIYVEKLDAEAGASVKFDRVLAVIDEENTVFGTPTVEGAVVTANVVKNGRGRKIRVYKMKPKKGYQRLQGHRQPYTKVQIETIG